MTVRTNTCDTLVSVENKCQWKDNYSYFKQPSLNSSLNNVRFLKLKATRAMSRIKKDKETFEWVWKVGAHIEGKRSITV